MFGFIRRVLSYAAFVGAVGPAAVAGDNPAADAHVDARFYLATRSRPAYVEHDPRDLAVWSALQSFYRARDYRLAWMGGGQPSRDAEAVGRIVARAPAEGLDGLRYRLLPPAPETVTLTSDWNREADADAIQDVQITYNFLKYAADLAGRFDPKAAGPFWLTRPQPRELAPWLEEALRTRRVAQAFAALAPAHPGYGALKEALLRYRAIEREGGWPELPARLALRRGARSPHVARLRARLAIESDFPATPAAGGSGVYDSALAEAVKRFQRRHGLAADGVLSPATMAALNVPIGERIRQIELNLERWRWLPRDLGRRYVIVNVPSFELTAYENGRSALAMKVVTGKPDRPTPIFGEDMTTVVFSPYWNVPPTIAEDEIIPAVRRDPGYLRRNNLELVRGTRVVGPAALSGRGDVQIRQRPGAQNSLGLIKFVFPNPFNVYLHDTPAEALFARPRRAFSHGCIRIEKPLAMARWVLSGLPQWTPPAIQAAMQGGRERQLPLPEPIPVYVAYHTVEAGDDGTVFFWPDVYGHDAAQMPFLPRGQPPSPVLPSVAAADDLRP